MPSKRGVMYYCNVDKEPEELTYKDITYHLKVCNKYDNMSSVPYTRLIEESKDLNFYKHIKHYNPKDQGTIIRWLYRGLSLHQALLKIESQLELNCKFAKIWQVDNTFSPYKGRFNFLKDGNVIDCK